MLTEPPAGEPTAKASSGKKRKSSGGASLAAELVDIVTSLGVELFKSADRLDDQGFASFMVRSGEGTHRETHAIRSTAFRRWLARLAYDETGKVNGRALGEAVEVLSGQAVYGEATHRVGIRVAGDHNTVVLDLGDETWGVIEITKGGWRTIPAHEADVRFIRPRGMLAAPRANGGGVSSRPPRFNEFAR